MRAAVRGAGQLERLGLRLKLEPAPVLRRELLAGIRAGAKVLVEDVRKAARDELPSSGGLNTYVAASPIATRTRLTGRQTGVRIVNTRKNADQSGNGPGIRFGTDTGRLRHPVFGHRDRWVTQQLPHAGWFTDTLDREAPHTQPLLEAAMTAVAVQLTRPL